MSNNKIIFLLLLLCSCKSVEYTEIKDGYYYGENSGLPGQVSIFVDIKGSKAFVDVYNHYYYKSYYFMFSDTLSIDIIDSSRFVSNYSIIFLKNKHIYYENICMPIVYPLMPPKTKLYLDTAMYNKMLAPSNNGIRVKKDTTRSTQ